MFSFITSTNCRHPSEFKFPMYVINAYGQQALCKLDLLDKETDSSKKNKLQFEAKECAWKALNIVSGVIGALPMLKTTNQCYPTLEELLQNEDKSIGTLKRIAKLHELLDDDEETIKICKEIKKNLIQQL